MHYEMGALGSWLPTQRVNVGIPTLRFLAAGDKGVLFGFGFGVD